MKILPLVLVLSLIISCNKNDKKQLKAIKSKKELIVTDPKIEEDKTTQANKKLNPKLIFSNQSISGITRYTKKDDLKKLFKKSQLKDKIIYYYEGIEVRGTEVSFDNPNDSFTIEWNENLTPELIQITNPKSNWQTKDGIKIGSTIKEVQTINTTPFIIYGYEIDNYLAGSVMNWKSRKLDGLNLQFEITQELIESEYVTIIGNAGFSSDSPILTKAGLKVKNISIEFIPIKEMNPSATKLLDLSIQGEKDFDQNQQAGIAVMDKMANGVKQEDLTQTEKNILSTVDETIDSYWDIVGDGCNWYCGGGPKKVSASSYLKSKGVIKYEPKNAHDLNYKNVWVEGVEGYGIGEYLLYTFTSSAPRINEIIIVNGYIKNKETWINNSRVKKLKMYIDSKPYAILNLKDIRGAQHFAVDPIGNSNRQDTDAFKTTPDWTIKFEILEVYKGLKYEDVAISEIYFDGIDVHCFAKGTQIQLADKSTKNIENLKIGDAVAYTDFKNGSIQSAVIQKLEHVIHQGLITYQFASGLTITATQDHPFFIQDKGWSSLQPNNSSQYKGFDNIQKINIGDLFLTTDGTDQLIAIDFLEGNQDTYTVSKLSSGNNFIANGFIVGVEALQK